MSNQKGTIMGDDTYTTPPAFVVADLAKSVMEGAMAAGKVHAETIDRTAEFVCNEVAAIIAKDPEFAKNLAGDGNDSPEYIAVGNVAMVVAVCTGVLIGRGAKTSDMHGAPDIARHVAQMFLGSVMAGFDDQLKAAA